jgi:hypothetical protein
MRDIAKRLGMGLGMIVRVTAGTRDDFLKAHRTWRGILRRPPGGPSCISPFQGEADLERYLVVADLAVLDVPARLNDFKPIHISDGLVRFRYGGGNRILDARFG